MDKLKVLVVDDSVIYRNNISRTIEDTGLGIVEHSLPNGELAFEWLRHGSFDLIFIDAYLAVRNACEIITDLRDRYPQMGIIIMRKDTVDSIAVTFEALERGAMDFIVKPSGAELTNEWSRLKNQLHILIAQTMVRKCSSAKKPDTYQETSKEIKESIETKESKESNKAGGEFNKWNGADIVLIASSTGGPAALEKVFSLIPADFSRPILVVQHMPAEFTSILARTLDKKYPFPVSEGNDGAQVKDNHAVIAPGDLHMKVEAEGESKKFIRLENSPSVNGVRPSADVLFSSVAKAYKGKNVLAVILTGMGNDGMKGVSEIKKSCNCYCITQSEETCVVYGMPKSVHEAGLSDEEANLEDIAGRICQMALTGGRGRQ